MNTSRVLPLKILGDMWKQTEVDGVCDERGEWSEALDQSEKDFEESIESMLCVVQAEFSL